MTDVYKFYHPFAKSWIGVLEYYNQEDLLMIYQAINYTMHPGFLKSVEIQNELSESIKSMLKDKITGKSNNYDLQAKIGLHKHDYSKFYDSDLVINFLNNPTHLYRMLAILFAMPVPGT